MKCQFCAWTSVSQVGVVVGMMWEWPRGLPADPPSHTRALSPRDSAASVRVVEGWWPISSPAWCPHARWALGCQRQGMAGSPQCPAEVGSLSRALLLLRCFNIQTDLLWSQFCFRVSTAWHAWSFIEFGVLIAYIPFHI